MPKTQALPPCLAWWDRDTLVIDGIPIEPGKLPRAEYWAGRSAYIVGNPRWTEIIRRYARKGDTVAGPQEGQIASVGVSLGRRGVSWHIRGYDSWGLDPMDREKAAKELRDLYDEVLSEGVDWTGTAAGTARAGMVGLCPPEEMIALPPKFAECSRGQWGAMTQGPQWVGRGEAERAATIDRKAAYLEELRGPFPRVGHHGALPGWKAGKGRALPLIIADLLKPGAVGVLSGVVFAPPPRGCAPGGLPIRLRGHRPLAWVAGYPGDRVAAGTWSAPILRAAIAQGAEIREVYGGWIAKNPAPWLEYFAEWADGRSPLLRRLLYTRGWGALAASGWAQGEVGGEKKAGGTIQAITAEKAIAWWNPEARFELDRPDAASQIAGRNAEQVFRLMANYSPDDIVCVSLDAVTVRDGAYIVPDGWTVKRDGGGRWWAPGWYEHAGTIARSGRAPWMEGDADPSDLSSSPCRWSYPRHPDPMTASGGSARSPYAVAAPMAPGEAMGPNLGWDSTLIPALPGDPVWGPSGYPLSGGRMAPPPRLAGDRSER